MKSLKLSIWIILLTTLHGACQNQNKATPFKRVSSTALKTMLSEGELQLVDVRTPQEVSRGYIKGMEHMSISEPDFAKKIDKLDKSKPVIFYCARGNRSQKAAAAAIQAGFLDVYDVKDGFMGWSANGFEITF